MDLKKVDSMSDMKDCILYNNFRTIVLIPDVWMGSCADGDEANFFAENESACMAFNQINLRQTRRDFAGVFADEDCVKTQDDAVASD